MSLNSLHITKVLPFAVLCTLQDILVLYNGVVENPKDSWV